MIVEPLKKLALKGMLTMLLGVQQARLHGHVRVRCKERNMLCCCGSKRNDKMVDLIVISNCD
jgi:CDGSH-type Zn-finger protein